MLSNQSKVRLDYALGSGDASSELEALLQGASMRNQWFVDTFNGDAKFSGKSWREPFVTMAAALAVAQGGDTIFFRGDIREQLVGSNLVFDITIIGVGSLHHPDQPESSAPFVDPGAACWRGPVSLAAATPLIEVRGRGWKFYNIMFDCPPDAAGIRLVRNSSSGVDEYDASHSSIIGCDFRNGLRGIEDSDGTFNVTVRDCVFETLDATTSGAGIITVTNTGVAASRRWRILNNFFQAESSTHADERHIVGGFVGSLIKGNVFGTVKGTGKYVDLTGGSGNVVTGNYMHGNYDTGDYVAGTGDGWAGNFSANPSSKATVGDNGVTNAVPGA